MFNSNSKHVYNIFQMFNTTELPTNGTQRDWEFFGNAASFEAAQKLITHNTRFSDAVGDWVADKENDENFELHWRAYSHVSKLTPNKLDTFIYIVQRRAVYGS